MKNSPPKKIILKLVKEIDLLSKVRNILLLYIRGQLLVMLITMLIYWTVLTFLGIKQALLLAVLSAVMTVVPIFGMWISALISILVVVFDNERIFSLIWPYEAILVLVIYLVINQLIDWFLSPYLIGRSLKVHPLIILFSVLIGMSFFGIIGAVLAAPFVAVIQSILTSQKKKRDGP